MNDVIKKNVDHPSHYNQEGRKECIEEMREKFGDLAVYWFCKLNAYKYDYRAGNKDGNSKEQDNAKIRWYDDYAEKLQANIRVDDIMIVFKPRDDQDDSSTISLDRTICVALTQNSGVCVDSCSNHDEKKSFNDSTSSTEEHTPDSKGDEFR